MSGQLEAGGPAAADATRAANAATRVVRITVALTPKGYRAVLLHLSALKLRLVVPLMAFFGFASLGAGFDTQGVLILSSMVGIVLTVWGYIAWNASSPSRIELYEPVAYEFGVDGIVYASASGAGTIEWGQVAKWGYAVGHYLLYVAGASYLVVPECDIADGEVDAFETLLRAHVRKSPRRRF